MFLLTSVLGLLALAGLYIIEWFSIVGVVVFPWIVYFNFEYKELELSVTIGLTLWIIILSAWVFWLKDVRDCMIGRENGSN